MKANKPEANLPACWKFILYSLLLRFQVPVILYHGSTDARQLLRKDMMKLHTIRPGIEVHPVVITSYEIAMNDRRFIGNFPWKYIIVDEGHRIKNFQCRLIK